MVVVRLGKVLIIIFSIILKVVNSSVWGLLSNVEKFWVKSLFLNIVGFCYLKNVLTGNGTCNVLINSN